MARDVLAPDKLYTDLDVHTRGVPYFLSWPLQDRGPLGLGIPRINQNLSQTRSDNLCYIEAIIKFHEIQPTWEVRHPAMTTGLRHHRLCAGSMIETIFEYHKVMIACSADS